MNTRPAYYILDPKTDTKQEGDEMWSDHTCEWIPSGKSSPLSSVLVYRRLVTPPTDWIEWKGGECPVPKGTMIQWRVRGGSEASLPTGSPAELRDWKHDGRGLDIIAYRIVKPAPEPEYVPLGPDDVPPGSCLKPKPTFCGWIIVSEVDSVAVHLHGGRSIYWEDLMNNDWQIKRPSEDWQPCKKLK